MMKTIEYCNELKMSKPEMNFFDLTSFFNPILGPWILPWPLHLSLQSVNFF